MKTLLLSALLAFFSGAALSQEYAWVQETNPDFETSGNSDVIMHGGKLYQVHDSMNAYLDVSVYDPATMTWTQKAHLFAGGSYGLQTEIIGDKIYTAVQAGNSFEMYIYDISDELLTAGATNTYSAIPSANWKFIAGTNDDQLYVLFIDNGFNVVLNAYDGITDAWSSQDYTATLNPNMISTISSAGLEMYLTLNELYLGVSGEDNRIGFTSISNLTTITAYNSGGSGDAAIYIDGTQATTNATFYFTGNGQDAPYANVRSGTLIKTWQVPVGSSDIAISTATATPLDFNVTQNAYSVISHPAYSFLLSNFIPNGGGTSNKFYLYRQDLATMTWDSVGPKLESNFPLLVSNSLRTSLDFPGQQHIAAQYATNATSGNPIIKVLTHIPYVVTASTVPNTNLCPGHFNEIFPAFELFDADVEPVRILSITALNGSITNFQAVANGYYDSSNPSVSKYKIFGTINTGGNEEITITFTDGWTIESVVVPVVLSGNAPNVTFSQTPIIFCDNENIIDLENYVSYSNSGIFTMNGQQLQSSTINGITESVLNPSGTIYYQVSVDGCYVETGVTFSFAQAGTASAVTTAATCGNTNGMATITFNPGTSSNVTYEWSTGEITPAIGSLTSGAYYYGVTDEFGCHTTGFASVAASGITVTPSITNVSCAGANDGSISIAVTGSANYSVLWSNGYSTNSISNLAPGNYEVTIIDAAGCQVTYSYNVTSPAAITADLQTSAFPGCGLTNGAISGTYGGGTGTLSYNWLGQGQTTPNLANAGFGYYGVKVTDLSGCTDTFYHQLNNFQSVAISDSIVNATCELSNGAILVNLTAAPGGNNASSFSWSNGSIYEDNENLAAGTYTLTVGAPQPLGTNTCYSQKIMTVGIKPPVRQEICMVTVDLATTTNLVIWEKVEFGIDHYNIYRENAVAGTYMLIDTVDDGSESIFNDVVVSPIDRSWRYRISAVNACGVEGPVSHPHKTLHLNSINVLANGSVDVFWDDYEGQTAPEYVVWRMTDQNGWEALAPAVPFGTSFFNDVPPTGSTGLDYYVEMVLGFQCTAEKAQDFNSSRSNKDKGQFASGNGTGDSSNGLDELNGATITVYPNPFNDYLMVNVANAVSELEITVFSIDGHAVSHSVISNGINKLDLQHLQSGMYFIRSGRSAKMTQFIKL